MFKAGVHKPNLLYRVYWSADRRDSVRKTSLILSQTNPETSLLQEPTPHYQEPRLCFPEISTVFLLYSTYKNKIFQKYISLAKSIIFEQIYFEFGHCGLSHQSVTYFQKTLHIQGGVTSAPAPGVHSHPQAIIK